MSMVAVDIAVLERVSRSLVRVQKIEDLRRIEAALTKKFAAHFRHQSRSFIAALSKFRGQFDEAISPGSWNSAWDQTVADTAPAMEVTIHDAADKSWRAGAKRVVADFGIATSFSLPNPRAVAFLEEHAATRVTGINETTRSYIRTLMTRAVDEGWSYDQTARTLTARFSQFAVGNPLKHIESRAHLIAVTESAFAYEHATASVTGDLMEQGLPMVKFWITVGDDRVDEEQCGPNEDQGIIPAQDTFQDGSSEPPAHPGCRCTTGYEVDPDFIGDTTIVAPGTVG